MSRLTGPWRAAVLDLNGHFVVAVPCRERFLIFNTTDFNYLEGPGALTIAVAFDLMVVPSGCEHRQHTTTDAPVQSDIVVP